MALSVLDTSHKWNHTLCGLLCLPSFRWHVFKVHPCCSMCQYFIPFHGWIIFHWMNIWILFIHSWSIFLTKVPRKLNKGKKCLSTNGAITAEYPKSKKWTSILISLNTQIEIIDLNVNLRLSHRRNTGEKSLWLWGRQRFLGQDTKSTKYERKQLISWNSSKLKLLLFKRHH